MANNKQDLSQFGSAKPAQTGDPRHCAQCEAMLTDALDGTLSPADQAAFDLHLVGCPACSIMTADAQRGAAWLELLKTPRPEPPATLLNRILAQTSGVASSVASKPAAEISPALPNTLLGRPTLVPQILDPQILDPQILVPQIHTVQIDTVQASNVLPFRIRFNLRNLGQTLLQPRLAMTAAMAFFSVALTLNLTGVRLTQLRAGDLRPSSLKRSFSEANAHVVRYYDNLRVVYELESRVHDLQQSSGNSADLPAATTPDSKAAPAQAPNSQQPKASPDRKNSDPDQAKPRTRPGTSRRENLGPNLQFVAAASANPDSSPVPYLSQSLAALLPGIHPSNDDRPSLQPDRAARAVQEGTLV